MTTQRTADKSRLSFVPVGGAEAFNPLHHNNSLARHLSDTPLHIDWLVPKGYPKIRKQSQWQSQLQ